MARRVFSKAGAVTLCALACLFATLGFALAEDRHAGYYYPAPGGSESHALRVLPLPGTGARRRVGFVIAITNPRIEKAYPRGYVMFAKGQAMEKLIVTATEANRDNTLFRLRALLDQLTAVARASPLFQNAAMPDHLTFFDLCGMIGFKQITVTNGDRIAHRIALTR